MDFLNTIIFSIVEGLTEFLPVSSTGHLNLTRVILNIPKSDFFTTFEIFIQLGAILAVVVLYFKRVMASSLIWKKILVSFIPTGIIGLIFGKFIKNFLVSNEYITLLALFLGGIALIILELLYKEKEHHFENIEKIPYMSVVLIGLFQAIAVVPGVSRSAATIVGALFLGIKRKTAVEFSFLLAVPTMLAATIFDLNEANFNFSSDELSFMTFGFIGSFITAIFAIKFFLNFIKNHTFIPFGIYRIALSVLFYFLIIK